MRVVPDVAILTLDDPRSRKPAEVGAKAAGLAAARAAGLPALPGVVLAVTASRAALTRAAALVASRGVHAARLTMMDDDIPGLTSLGEAAGGLGKDLVVRSSAPGEDAPELSGVFASYVGVTNSDLATAVRGVWASALREGTGPSSQVAGIAVLVQPEVHPWLAGTARLLGNHRVELTFVVGSPAPLLSGGVAGDSAQVDLADGTSTVAQVSRPLTGDEPQSLGRVADLAARVQAALGHDLIEWALWATGEVVLLQSKRASTLSAPPPPLATPAVSPAALGIARLVFALAGPLGEQLMLPMLLTGADEQASVPRMPVVTGPVTAGAARAAWKQARAAAARLTAEHWPADRQPVSEVLQMLRNGIIPPAVEQICSHERVAPAEVDAVLDLLGVVAARLVQTGAVARTDRLWGLYVEDVEPLLSGLPPATVYVEPDRRRRAAARWAPFVFAAVADSTAHLPGSPAAPGIGVGPAVWLAAAPDEQAVPLGSVLVAPRPLPWLAPLLWGAAGLVTFGGSVAAHLVEVARSVGVPTVVGCPEAAWRRHRGAADPGPVLVAVDGTAGWCAVDTRTLFASAVPGESQ